MDASNIANCIRLFVEHVQSYTSIYRNTSIQVEPLFLFLQAHAKNAVHCQHNPFNSRQVVQSLF
jgi:hypothetical protein